MKNLEGRNKSFRANFLPPTSAFFAYMLLIGEKTSFWKKFWKGFVVEPPLDDYIHLLVFKVLSLKATACLSGHLLNVASQAITKCEYCELSVIESTAPGTDWIVFDYRHICRCPSAWWRREGWGLEVRHRLSC